MQRDFLPSPPAQLSTTQRNSAQPSSAPEVLHLDPERPVLDVLSQLLVLLSQQVWVVDTSVRVQVDLFEWDQQRLTPLFAVEQGDEVECPPQWEREVALEERVHGYCTIALWGAQGNPELCNEHEDVEGHPVVRPPYTGVGQVPDLVQVLPLDLHCLSEPDVRDHDAGPREDLTQAGNGSEPREDGCLRPGGCGKGDGAEAAGHN